ncbi:MAG: tRNA dihydrouridine synthase DusB [Actinomycetota bacterium]|nr:tRNA dihydrouridine synthase DusB [Actinomycetota bacterium]
MSTFRIGSFAPIAPVVLAPMAGVTNAPFRTMCRQFAPGLLYVNEMVMATAVVHGNPKTKQMMTFAPDEQPRSLQVYGSDPVMLGEAIRKLCAAGSVDHIDMNFGCPAAKVTRKGGGAAVPAKPNLLRAILRSAVAAAQPYGVPITIKFRKGLYDSLLTHVQTGRIAAEEGIAAIALHARTAEQHYAGTADWHAIAELKQAVPEIPVLGNGDIWEAADAVRMMRETGCDGVVVGRGCLGRPWLFRDLVDAMSGRPVQPAPALGEACTVMAEHARLLVAHHGENLAMRDFRKHTSWYFTGYPVGGEVRRRFSNVSTLMELDDLIATLDPTTMLVEGGERIRRGHTNGPIRVALPDGYLQHLDDLTVPDDAAEMAVSGG